MARIVMADRDIAFDGQWTGDKAPDDGAFAFVRLAEALAARGHRVQAHTGSSRRFTARGVAWEPIESGLPDEADLFIVSRSHRLLKHVPRARQTAIWLHQSGLSLMRWGRVSAFARRRPAMAFLGVYHAASYPGWAPGGRRAIIPLATDPVFRTAAPSMRPPPPFAIWAGRPGPALAWLLDVWAQEIRPESPKAQLYVFADPNAEGAIVKACAMKDVGVVVRAPGTADEHAEELRQSRVFLHAGEKSDMFCMAAAEAQAMGVPAVIGDVACMRERVVNRETGFVVPPGDAKAFARAALTLLTDDALWREQRDAALRYNRTRGWDDVAAEFEELRR